MHIAIRELRGLVEKALSKRFDVEAVQLITDAILFGQLSGKTSHGIIRLVTGTKYSILNQIPSAKPEVINKTAISKVIKGNGNPGVLIAALATREVIEIAKGHSVGFVGTVGTTSTSGCLSYFLEKIGREDLIGIVMAQSEPSMVGFNSRERLFGTNPIGFTVPGKTAPFIFDMATSAVSYGELYRALAVNESLPENVAVDALGKATVDPQKAIEGALLPFDRSYKGSALAMVVELLAGAWPGASCVGIGEEYGWGNLFIAFSPSLLEDTTEFKLRITKCIDRIRNATTTNGKKVRIPGETCIAARDQCIRRRKVEVDEVLIKRLKEFISRS